MALIGAGRRSGRCSGPGQLAPGAADGRQLFGLTFVHRGSGASFDRLDSVVERSSSRLDRGQATQAVRVALFGQIQHGVSDVQVRRSAMPIGEAFDGHISEDGGQGSAMSGLDAAVADTVDVDHRDSFLSAGAQVEVVLEQSTKQLSAATVEIGLQLGVGARTGLGALQPADDVGETRPGPAERAGVGGSDGPGGAHRRRRRWARRSRRAATLASALASRSARAVL